MSSIRMTFACALLAASLAPSAAALADEQGHASWYALTSTTASGERMNPDGMTAAHRTLPFGTRVKVENLNNGRAVVLRINDRGPFVGGRIIDVSRAAATELGFIGAGTANVRVTVVGSGNVGAGAAGQGETGWDRRDGQGIFPGDRG